MRFLKYFIILSVILVVICAQEKEELDLPSNFKKCARSDPKFADCVKEAAEIAVKNMINGIPSLGVSSIDPLYIKSFEVLEGEGSSLNIKQSYRDIQVLGLRNVRVNRVRVDPEKCKYIVDSSLDKMELVGNYEIEGKVLILPVTGKGYSNITLVGTEVRSTVICEQYFDGDGKEHYHNLFNGDKILGDGINKFLNENWETLYNEFKGGHEKAMEKVFLDIVNQLFSKLPNEKIFLD